MTKEEEQKVDAVCEALDGNRVITVGAPYTGMGNGCIIEVEEELERYYKDHSSIPDVLVVSNIGDFTVACTARARKAIFFITNSNLLLGDYINYYRFHGKEIRVKF